MYYCTAEYGASLWMTSFYRQGNLYISSNYASFHSELHDELFTVVISFKDIVEISLVDHRLIQVDTQQNRVSLTSSKKTGYLGLTGFAQFSSFFL